MHILVISYQLYNYSSVGHCARKIIKSLDDAGANITVVTRPIEQQCSEGDNYQLLSNDINHIFTSSDLNVFLKMYTWLKNTPFSKLAVMANGIFKHKMIFDIESWLWCNSQRTSAYASGAICISECERH